jgi:hypothetical protein
LRHDWKEIRHDLFPEGAMNAPLECRVRHRSRRDHFAFAQEAKQRLASAPDLLLGKSHRGLHLIAGREPALETALATLHENYGDVLHVERNDGCEPIVDARIGVERGHLGAVRAALRRRGGNPTEEYGGSQYCVLRVELPAGSLLGLAAELETLSAARATHQFVVSGWRHPPVLDAAPATEKEMT